MCNTVLIEIEPKFQLCSKCGKATNDKGIALIKNRKSTAPEHKKKRKKFKVGILR